VVVTGSEKGKASYRVGAAVTNTGPGSTLNGHRELEVMGGYAARICLARGPALAVKVASAVLVGSKLFAEVNPELI